MATFDNITLEIIEDSVDKTGFPVKARIKYNEFDKEVQGSVIEMVLRWFLAQEKSSLTPVEFINKVRGAKKDDSDKEPPKPEPPKPEPPKPEPDPKKGEEQDKKKRKGKEKGKDDDSKKGNKSGVAVRWIAGTLVVGILATGGYHICKHLLSGDKDDTKQPVSPPAYEQQIDEHVGDQNEPITDVSIEGSELLPYVNRGSTDWIAMSDDEYLIALNSQTIACQMNMPEISIFLEGGELEGDKHVSYIQNSFRNQSPDFVIVEYFNQCRNDVVNAAYDTRNRDNVRLIQDLHMRDLYLFITNQKSITLNTYQGEQTFYWNTISDEARNAILDVFFGLTISLDHGYVLTVDGATFTPAQLGQLYEAELARLKLINPTFRAK